MHGPLARAALIATGILGISGCDPASLPQLATNIDLPNLSGIFNLDSLSQSTIGDELLVADAITGERCRVRKAGNGGDLNIESFVVLCAGWTQPSGWLRRFDADPDIELARLLDDSKLSLWQPGTAQCEEPSSQLGGVDGEPIWIRECITSDGWPMLAWASRGRIDSRIGAYVGYGLPQLASIVEPLLAGEATQVTVGSQSALVSRARLQASADGSLVSLDDIMSFRKLVRLALAHNQSGEFADAALAYERALAIRAAGKGGGDVFSAPILAAWGLNLASDARGLEAIAAFDRAAENVDKIAWSDAYPTYLAYRAAYERKFGDLKEAERLASESTELRVGLFGGDSTAVAASRLLQSGIAQDEGQIVEARNLMSEALIGFERARDPVGQSFVHAARAKLELRSGNLAKAREHGVKARELMLELFGEGRNLAEVALDLGSIEAGLGNNEAALSAFRQATAAADNARYQESYLSPEELEPYLALLFRMAQADRANADALFAEALVAVQIPRRVTIERSLRRMSARLSAVNPQLQDLVVKYEDKQQELSDTRIALTQVRLGIEEAGGGRDEAALEQRIAALKSEISEDESWLQRQHPRYGSLVAPGVIRADAASGLLRSGEAFVQLFVTDDAAYVLMVSADGQVSGRRSATGRLDIESRVKAISKALTFAQGLQPFDLGEANRLYTALFGDILDNRSSNHLIMVADSALLSLPLGVLPMSPASAGDYAHASWLGRDKAISYVSSLSSLQALRQSVGQSQAPLAFAGIGDPMLGGRGDTRSGIRAAYDACQQGGEFDPKLLNALARLPETADELRNVAQTLGGSVDDLQLGPDANETRVKELDLSRYRTISFATHGLLPGEIRCRNEPGLVLTPPGQATEGNDGLLTASEIVGLDLDADLVVLSACNTAGPNGELGGEALSGLAAAFTTAGARRVIASHWDVESDSTVQLMQSTFDFLATSGGTGHAFALQQARRKIMDDPNRAHPAFWAPFVLIGDGGGQSPS